MSLIEAVDVPEEAGGPVEAAVSVPVAAVAAVVAAAVELAAASSGVWTDVFAVVCGRVLPPADEAADPGLGW